MDGLGHLSCEMFIRAAAEMPGPFRIVCRMVTPRTLSHACLKICITPPSIIDSDSLVFFDEFSPPSIESVGPAGCACK